MRFRAPKPGRTGPRGASPPEWFLYERPGKERWVPIRRRTGLDETRALSGLAGLDAVEWGGLHDAYGPATEVPTLLLAVAVGDEETRSPAWWNLWGRVLHQGSVYEATLPTIEPLVALATWGEYPDRPEALAMLCEAARSDDVRVWRYDGRGEIVHDEFRQRWLRGALRAAVRDRTAELLGTWREEPDRVRRAQLWMLSSLPASVGAYRELVDSVLPAEHREAWRALLVDEDLDEDGSDRIWALEAWVNEPT